MNFSINKLVRENILAMKPYSSARDEFSNASEQMVFLDANENPYDDGLNRYPDPHQEELKQAIARQKECEQSQILLGNGSDEVLDLLFRAFCEPSRDSVVTLPPTYGMYKVLANLNNVKTIEVLLDDSFMPNVSAILAAIEQNTKIIFLCSPNNPTGNSFPEESIIRLLNEFDGLVVIDEAYIDFSSQKSWLHRLEEFPNLIITQTFSKALGMAGIRLGMCFASVEIINVLKKIKPPYNVNALSQQNAIDKLANKYTISSNISSIISNKSYLSKQLLQINFITKIFPSDANFLLIKVDDANLRYSQLMKRGVVVRNRTNEPLCLNTLRITVGTIEQNNVLVNALKQLEA